ncbi:MAG: PAS domain-containing protein, partial [Candidatus Marinimicrobia bacterium]|nr:PAS domain-containing protein [Candidatus Neomarinimicrobiota bacterium]
QSELQLKESEEKFRTVVANTRGIIYMIDKNGTFTLSEGSDLVKLGLKPGEVVGRSVYDIYKVFPDMLDDMKKTFSGKPIFNEVKVGDTYFKNWYTPSNNNKGETIGLLGLSIDITEQKLAENKIKQLNENLEKRVDERTHDLQKTINLMAGREVRMVDLKNVIKKLHTQLESAGLKPEAVDPIINSVE